MQEFDKVQEARDYIQKQDVNFKGGVGIILGSGLGSAVPEKDVSKVIPYEKIPHFPKINVPGHAGMWQMLRWGGQNCHVMKGRVHYYEGHSLQDVVFPIRLMAALGVKTIILTNASGLLRKDWPAGSLGLLTDHINTSGLDPLRGANDDRFGPRFPDHARAYAPDLRALAMKVAKDEGIPLREAVYAYVPGPSYETAAEARMLKTLGADMVGMSTVPEVIAASHLKLKILAFSFATNYAAGLRDSHLEHKEVVEMTEKGSATLSRLLGKILEANAGANQRGGGIYNT